MSWPMVALGEVAEFNPRMPKLMPDDIPVSFLPMAAVSEDGAITYSEHRTIAEVRKGYTHFRRGDVLLAKITPCFENGKATRTADLTTEVGAGSTEFHVIRAGDQLDPSYVFHMLWNERFRADAAGKMTGSAGQRRVPVDVVKSRAIPLPPLPEQRRIAGILDAADALRRRRREAIETLGTLQGALFAEMFGSTNAPHVFLGDAEKFLTSGSRGWAKYYADSGPVFIRIGNVGSGSVSLDDLICVSPPATKEADRTRVEEGDVLISITADLGRIAVVPEHLSGNAHINQHLALYRHDGRFNSTYLAHALMAQDAQTQMFRLGRGGTKAGLNFADIRSFTVPCPTKDVQGQFADGLKKHDASRTAMTTHLAHLDALFSALQFRAFAGEL